MRTTKIKDMRPVMQAVVGRLRRSVEAWERMGSTNPQVIAMQNRDQGRLDIAEAVEAALRGDTINLKIFAGE